MKRYQNIFKTVLVTFALILINVLPVIAATQNVTMTVGEEKWLYLPSSVTSLTLKGSPQFYSTSPAHVEITSYGYSSIKVKAKQAYSSPIIVRCDYYYLVRNGNYTYQMSGYFDWKVTVVGIDPVSVSLPSEMTLYVGQSATLNPVLNPSNATTTFTWSSSDYPTINVDNNGRILAQRTGSSTITVRTANGKTASCYVTAIRQTVEVTDVRITPSTLTLNVGDTYDLSATVYPSNATNKSLTWSKWEQSGALTLSGSGHIKATSAGKVSVYATADNGVYGVCVVTINEVIPSLSITDGTDLSNIPAKANVTYSRQLRQGWNSVCLPFEISTSMLIDLGDVETSIVKKYDKSNGLLLLEHIEKIPAGTPFLIHVEKDVEWQVRLQNAALVSSPVQTQILKGSFKKLGIGAGCLKISADGKSFSETKTDEAISMPFRCYIDPK